MSKYAKFVVCTVLGTAVTSGCTDLQKWSEDRMGNYIDNFSTNNPIAQMRMPDGRFEENPWFYTEAEQYNLPDTEYDSKNGVKLGAAAASSPSMSRIAQVAGSLGFAITKDTVLTLKDPKVYKFTRFIPHDDCDGSEPPIQVVRETLDTGQMCQEQVVNGSGQAAVKLDLAAVASQSARPPQTASSQPQTISGANPAGVANTTVSGLDCSKPPAALTATPISDTSASASSQQGTVSINVSGALAGIQRSITSGSNFVVGWKGANMKCQPIAGGAHQSDTNNILEMRELGFQASIISKRTDPRTGVPVLLLDIISNPIVKGEVRQYRSPTVSWASGQNAANPVPAEAPLTTAQIDTIWAIAESCRQYPRKNFSPCTVRRGEFFGVPGTSNDGILVFTAQSKKPGHVTFTIKRNAYLEQF